MQTQNLKTLVVFTTFYLREALLLHPCKPPIIERTLPDKNERYDLDDSAQCKLLGVNFKAYWPRADEYDHYPQCKWAIIECKGNSLKNSIEQLEYTAKQLMTFHKNIALAIIIANKINKKEKHYFTKKGNVLYRKKDDKPVAISTGIDRILVNIYSPSEIERQYQEFDRSLDKWQF
jgi:hypothetical protein